MALSGFKWMVNMSGKKANYRVNFTMPKTDGELNKKINELFERHREIGTLRHWLMALATEAAQKELGIASTLSSAAPAPAKPKIESLAVLEPKDPVNNKPETRRAKSKELQAYESLVETIKSEDGYDPNDTELMEIIEAARPLRLSDYQWGL